MIGPVGMRNVLLTPGPTNVPPAIAAALQRTDHSHRDEATMGSLARVRRAAVDLLGGGDAFTCLPLACSGTGANEALVGAVAGRLLVLEAGRYSRRIGDIVARCRVPAETLSFDPWSGIDLGRVDAVLAERPDLTEVFLVHLETTSGALAPLRGLGEIVHARSRRLLVDAIGSAFGHPLDLRLDRVTACTITPNKCLEGPPGLAMVVADTSWLATLAGRARSYYFDLHVHFRQLSAEGTPAFTVSPGLLAATDVALARAREEGVERRGLRYRALRDRLRGLLAEAGLVVRRAANDSNIVTVFALPPGLGPSALVAGMADAGFIVHSHDELTSQGLFGVATLGDLHVDDVVRFAGALAALHGACA